VQNAMWTMSPALTRLEANVRTRPFKSLVPKSRQTGPAPSDLCSGVGGSRRLPREEELGAPLTSIHLKEVFRARFCRKKGALRTSYPYADAV